jgi:5-methylcytosine-specific restriction endonuclease McrA
MKARKEVDRYNKLARELGFNEYSLNAHPDYRSKWRKVRKEVLLRDNYTCQVCGITKEKLLENSTGSTHKDYLNVAHIGDKEDIRLEMLITLCWDCHKDFDGRVSIYNENGKSTGYYYDKELKKKTRSKLGLHEPKSGF